MKYLVYLTICTANNKIYVGVHKTDDPAVFDGYIGNGVRINVPASYKKSKTPFQYAVNKYGISCFKRVTLGVFNTKKEAFDLESKIVTEDFIKRPDTYNIKLGGDGGCPEQKKRKVYMYDIEGNFEMEFETVYDCNKYFFPDATSGGHVPRAIKLGHLIMGHQVSYEKVPFMKKYKIKNGSHTPKKVGKFDEDGNLIEIFESNSACRKAGYNNITRALKQGIKHKGFYFKYLEN